MTGVDPLYRPALWVGSLGLVAWGLCLVIIPEHVLAWGQHVENLIEGTPDNVVPLPLKEHA